MFNKLLKKVTNSPDQDKNRPENIVIKEEAKEEPLKKKNSNNETHRNKFKEMLRQFKSKNKKVDSSFDDGSPKAKPPGIWTKMVFGQFNSIFDNGSKREIELHDLKPLPNHMKIETIFEKYFKARKELKQTWSKIFFGSGKIVYPILKVVKYDLLLSIILMIFNLSLIYLIPFLTKLLIKEIKTEKEVNIKCLIISISIVLTKLLIGLLNENFRDHRNKFKAGSGQILRGIFFEKVKNSNYRFLYDADAGFISIMIN